MEWISFIFSAIAFILYVTAYETARRGKYFLAWKMIFFGISSTVIALVVILVEKV